MFGFEFLKKKLMKRKFEAQLIWLSSQIMDCGEQDPRKPNLHLCIVNLVIGTLYCTKQNFEFGISRIIKSLDLYAKKIEMDTWFYAKRCFLALVDNLAKQMIVVQTAFSPKNQHFSLSILWAILTDDTMAKHFEAFQFNLIFFFTF